MRKSKGTTETPTSGYADQSTPSQRRPTGGVAAASAASGELSFLSVLSSSALFG